VIPDLAPIADFLFAPISLPAGWSTNLAEVLGFVFGVATVALAARNNAWTWPVGIANNAMWLLLFVSVALYADATLQVIYAAMSVYGTWHWLRGGTAGTTLPVAHAPRAELIQVTALSIAGSIAAWWALASFTNSTTPLPDAVMTVLSIAATWLLARRRIENWPLWIVGVNLPYMGLYLYKGLVLTALLQPVYIALSLAGWRHFRQELAAQIATMRAPGASASTVAALAAEDPS
jgi:nicotinamide mononucleotide transporter